MKLLTFLARSFTWQPHSRTIDESDTEPPADGVEDAVVVWAHAEKSDEEPEARKRAFKHTLKHVKWLAGKRDLKTVALHSFTHLGADSADPAFARAFLEELAERLRGTGYEVKLTPFGWFCSWNLDVHGESLAKVWKEI